MLATCAWHITYQGWLSKQTGLFCCCWTNVLFGNGWGCQSKWQWYVNKSDMNDLFSSISKGELISESFSLRLKSLKRGAKKLSSAFCLNVSRSQKKLSSRKNQTNEFVFLSWRLGNTWNQNSSFKYFRVVRIEKQFVCLFSEKLRLDNFVSRSTDLYI